MKSRLLFSALCAALLLSCGCVEVVQIITLNPDGTAKVEYDILTTPQAIQFASGGGGLLGNMPPAPNRQKIDVDDMKRRAVAALLTAERIGPDKGMGNVAAWKDVKAEWTPDGRLRIRATAYFQRVEDLHDWGCGVAYSFKPVDGKLRFVLTKNEQDLELPGNQIDKNDPPPDLARMNDKEWDAFLLRARIEYQNAKPFMHMMFSDMKAKTVVRLPGDASDIDGFTKVSPRVVSHEIDGKVIVKGINELYALNNASLKAKLKDAKSPDKLFTKELWPDAAVTVSKSSGDQFDFRKEVADAQAAYPRLRKEFQIDAKRQLPGEKSGPENKRSDGPK